MKIPFTNSVILLFIFLIAISLHGQSNSVGINTLNPNPNAVLELVSPNNNQGILIPRLTTAQRTSLSSLTQTDQGLLVYDISLQSLFWWSGTSWSTLSGGKIYSAGTGITIDINNLISGFDGNYNNLINKPSFPIYTAGTGISINTSNNIVNSLPDQLVELTGAGGTSISGVYPKFSITSTDNQDLSLNGSILSLTNDATSVDLSGFVNTDAQALSLTSNTLALTNGGSVNLAAYLDNTDTQNLSITGNSLNISGGTSVDLTPYLNTDAQTLSLTTNTLALTNGGSVSLAAYLDNTDAQDLTISGNTLTLTGDATTVDLSATVPTDKQILTWNGTTSKWEASNNYTAGTGITIDASNNINSLWSSASGTDVILANSMNNVGIGGDPLAGYKLFVNGKLQTSGINELSDERWKTEINPLKNSLDLVSRLQGVSYKWNIKNFPEKNFETGTQMGLIAQEVEKVLPYVVDTDVNGYKSVEYSHLVALLVEAIKEQQTIIKKQQSEIQSLNDSNASISNNYIQLETKLEKQQIQIDLLLKYMESSNTVQKTTNH